MTGACLAWSLFAGIAWTLWGVAAIIFRKRFAAGFSALWHEGRLLNFYPFWREFFRRPSGGRRSIGTVVLTSLGLVLIILGIFVASGGGALICSN